MVRLALCQANLPVGDIDGNLERLRARIREARSRGADLVVFPELALTGYPPEDLLLKPGFVRDAAAALQELSTAVSGIVALVGAPDGAADDRAAPRTRPALHNGAAVLADGGIAAVYHKHHLPNYAVFDERRYFTPGQQAVVIELGGRRLGVTVCEDIWVAGGPAEWAVREGRAEIVVNLSASPYHRAKGREREQLFASRCVDHGCFLAFCNAVGGQDELVFDGHSLVIAPDGTVLARGKQFEEELLIVDVEASRARGTRTGDDRLRRHGRPVRGTAGGRNRRPRRDPLASPSCPCPAARPPTGRRSNPDHPRTCSVPRRRCTGRSPWGRPTTFARTGFPAPCSASRGASTRRWRSPSRSTRSARRA